MLLLIANFIMHLWFECFQGKLCYQKFKRYITEYCRIWNIWKIILNLFLLNDDLSIYQKQLHFLTTGIFNSVKNSNPQLMWNYLSFKPIPYELTKGNVMHLPPAQSTQHEINSILYCGQCDIRDGSFCKNI